jgi:hypothetical protein
VEVHKEQGLSYTITAIYGNICPGQALDPHFFMWKDLFWAERGILDREALPASTLY